MKKTAHLLPVRREQREYCAISTFRKAALPVFPLRNTNVGLESTNVVDFAEIWMNEWNTCQNSPSPHERGVWTWCRSRWGRVGGSPRRSPPCLQSPWALGMRICREVMSIECRGQNQNCYRNPFWGLVKMKCVSWFCIKLLLWFSELSKYTFNFYFQNRYKVKDQHRSQAITIIMWTIAMAPIRLHLKEYYITA